MAVTKRITDGGGKQDEENGQKIIITTQFRAHGAGHLNKTMLINGTAIPNVQTRAGFQGTKNVAADAIGETPKKVESISWSMRGPAHTDIGGDCGGLVFAFCTNSSGDNPQTFAIVGGLSANGTLTFPVPLETPFSDVHISVVGKGPRSLAGGKGGGFTEGGTFNADCSVTMRK